MSRMSTDAPTGGLSYDEETWDVARVRHVEDTWKQAGNVSLVAAARHRESGELAAYSVLELAPSKPWLAEQDDTLVAANHRGAPPGHAGQDRQPPPSGGLPGASGTRHHLQRCAENDHMLAINVALGFRPAGWDGEWQKWSTAVSAIATSAWNAANRHMLTP